MVFCTLRVVFYAGIYGKYKINVEYFVKSDVLLEVINSPTAINNFTFLTRLVGYSISLYVVCFSFPRARYFHKHFILLLCGNIKNTKFCMKISIQILCNPKLFLLVV